MEHAPNKLLHRNGTETDLNSEKNDSLASLSTVFFVTYAKQETAYVVVELRRKQVLPATDMPLLVHATIARFQMIIP